MIHKSHHLVGLAAAALALAVAGGCSQGADQPTALDTPANATTAVASAAQPAAGYTISAKGLPQADGTMVQLQSYRRNEDGGWIYDQVASTQVKNGAFTIHGPQLSVPMPARLMIDKFQSPDHAEVGMILGNAAYRVHALGDTVVAEGGKYNDLIFGYTRQSDYVAAVGARDAAERKVYAGIDPDDQKARLQAKMDSIDVMRPHYVAVAKIAGAWLNPIIEQSDDELARFYAFVSNPDMERYSEAERAAMLDGFGQTLGDNPAYQNLMAARAMDDQAAQARDALAVGKPYRDIVATDKDGKQVRLSEVLKNNQFVLLDFWAAWCAPCRAEFPYLAKVYHDYHDAGFEIYGVSLDEEQADWLKALKQESDNGHVPWINLRAGGFGSAAAAAYGVRGLPNNYLIAHDGTIAGKDMRGNDVEKVVAKALEKAGQDRG